MKLLKDVDLPEPEFCERIASSGAVQHELVVPVHAYYISKDEKLLVDDYLSMDSLSALLHDKQKKKNQPHEASFFTVRARAVRCAGRWRHRWFGGRVPWGRRQ